MENKNVTILVAEDDMEMLELLDRVLSEEGFEVIGAKNGTEALALLEKNNFDVVLSDIKMPGASGLDVLKSARSRFLHQPVILMTAFGSVESAVEAMKEGAYSYITKPFDLDDLLVLLAEVATQVSLNRQTQNQEKTPFPIIFRSQLFRNVLRQVESVADSSATVLITGESGVGKELIAQEIHRRSSRADQPFVALNVNAIPETLIESELFGHIRGSFTGAIKDNPGIIEQAQTGTLFLDEIGDLPLSVQVKLLRFFQERTFKRVGDTKIKNADVRLITATNKHLQDMITSGHFREDLYYRISVVNINVPPLRERREDVTPLAYHFLRKFNMEYKVEGFRPEVMDAFIDYDWPGNVRQLENAVEHAVVRRKHGMIQKVDLPDWLCDSTTNEVNGTRSLETIEREHILSLLEECGGNQSRTARILGIDRRTLSRKLKKYGMSVAEK